MAMDYSKNNEKILEVEDLVLSFKTDHGILKAVRNISFDLYKGETLCIVGESGSGKSVTSKAIMGILANNSIVEGGHIYYRGEDLLEVAEEEFHKIRGHKIGMIFQDPLSSLNPIVRIGKQITEATLINSNKLKLMYDDLISDDLIAYKNCLARGKHKADLVQNAYIKELVDFKKKYNGANGGLTNEEVNQKDALIKSSKDLKAKLDASNDEEEKKQINAELDGINAKIKEFDSLAAQRRSEQANERAQQNAELKAKKKEVNQQVKQIKAETLKQAAPLKEKLDQTKKEAKEKVKVYKNQVNEEYKAKVNEINASNLDENAKKEALAAAKLERINKLKITKAEAKRRALEIMKEVGIPEPEKRFKQYPFEFSGGMRQRIVIAIALTETPEILICDEPTTALDVTIQGQILELIKKIQRDRNLSIIFITHDLGVVANMADRVAVMYAGKIVEYGTSEEVFFDPKHPYTWALLSSIPDVDSKERLDAIPGTPPNMIYPPRGDAFALRSKYAMQIDFEEEPPFFKVSDTHYAATWLLHPNAPKVEMPKIVSERIANSLKAKKNGKEDR
jgi:oligopeptide transport system ATP-binding protein